MRSAEGDYAAIEASLRPHQLQTVHDLALAAGLAPHDWPGHTNARVIAKELAVANVVGGLSSNGVPLRKALNRAASMFDLDPETLQRHYREIRRRSPGSDTGE